MSPNSWNRERSPLNTPAVIGPECNPTRNRKSPVSGPSVTSNSRVKRKNSDIHSLAKRLITIA